jgi:hypothetical protein
LYAGVLSVLAAAIVGIVPALKATRRDVQTGLRIIGAGGSGLRLGKTWTVLIVTQVAFAVALLPAAISNAWGSIRSATADPGFAAKEFLSTQLGMDPAPDMEQTADSTHDFARKVAARQTELMRRLQAEPRIAGVTFAMMIPGDEPGALIETENAPSRSDAKTGGAVGRSGVSGRSVRFNRVDVNFFGTFNVPILAGRGFGPADITLAVGEPGTTPKGGAVIVNRTLAQSIFGGAALGRRIRYVESSGGATRHGASEPWHEIVGIVPDFPTGVSPGMDDSPLRLYHPVAAGQLQDVSMMIRVREGPPATFDGRLREIANGIDPDLHLRNTIGLDDALRREQWIRRMEAAVLSVVTLSVLMLSSAGIYALMSFTISQRRKEIGIRMALGAGRKRVVTSIFSRALGQLAVGAVLGMAPWIVLGKALVGDLLRGDAAIVLPAVVLFMMAMGFVAVVGPARRCLGIQPADALREQ